MKLYMSSTRLSSESCRYHEKKQFCWFNILREQRKTDKARPVAMATWLKAFGGSILSRWRSEDCGCEPFSPLLVICRMFSTIVTVIEEWLSSTHWNKDFLFAFMWVAHLSKLFLVLSYWWLPHNLWRPLSPRNPFSPFRDKTTHQSECHQKGAFSKAFTPCVPVSGCLVSKQLLFLSNFEQHGRRMGLNI